MNRLVFDITKLQSIEPQQLNNSQTEFNQAQLNIQILATQPQKVVIIISKRSTKIVLLLQQLAPKAWKNLTAWLLFQKLGKSIDNKNINLASQETQLQTLKVH